MAPASAPRPLSPSQELLWEFMSALAPHNPSASRELVVEFRRINGHLDRTAFMAAIDDIVRRHEVLRMVFDETGVDPLIRIAHAIEPSVTFHDLSGLAEQERGRRCDDVADAERLRVFDLRRGPLWQVNLIRLATAEHVLVLTFSHMIADGWAARIFVEDLVRAYRFRTDNGPPPTDLGLDFDDIIEMQSAVLAKHPARIAYWRRNLLPLPAYLPFVPTAAVAPDADLTAEVAHPVAFPADVVSQLRRAGWRANTTAYVALMAAYHILLALRTGATRVVIGTSTLGRETLPARRVMGQFTNDVCVAAWIKRDATLIDTVADVHEAMSTAAENPLPYKILASSINPRFADERPWPDNNLFDSYFQAAVPASPDIAHPDLNVSQIWLDGRVGADSPRALLASEVPADCLPVWVKRGAPIFIVNDDRRGGVMVVNRWFYDDDLVHGLIGDYVAIVEALVREPDLKVSAVRLPSQSSPRTT